MRMRRFTGTCETVSWVDGRKNASVSADRRSGEKTIWRQGMKIKQSRVEELYALYKKRMDCLTEHMECSCEDVFGDDALEAYRKTSLVEQEIEAKTDEISKESGIVSSLFAQKLMAAVFPLSISRYLQCLRVCGVEVEE